MRTFLRIVFIVVVAAVIIGTGIAIFNAGMVQGAAMSGQLSDGAPVPAAPYYAPIYQPWGFWFFPGFICFGVFGLFLLFGLGPHGLWPAPRLAARSVGHGPLMGSTRLQRRAGSARSSKTCTARCTIR